MARLYEYVIPVRKGTRAQFIAANPQPFLVLYEDEHDERKGWTFKTQTVSVTAARLARLARQEDLRLSPELTRYHVFVIAKASENPWPERISIGRARNNDVVLGDSSVSKLHAHFRQGKKGELFITDAGSRNGTRVNGKRVEPGEPVKVEVGDTITFGRADLLLLDAAGLYDLVSELVQEVANP